MVLVLRGRDYRWVSWHYSFGIPSSKTGLPRLVWTDLYCLVFCMPASLCLSTPMFFEVSDHTGVSSRLVSALQRTVEFGAVFELKSLKVG